MMCPECEEEMIWMADNEVEHPRYCTEYRCEGCDIDVIKYWNGESAQGGENDARSEDV